MRISSGTLLNLFSTTLKKKATCGRNVLKSVFGLSLKKELGIASVGEVNIFSIFHSCRTDAYRWERWKNWKGENWDVPLIFHIIDLNSIMT